MDIEKCFEILELPNNATFEEVKSSYLELVQVWHPDRFSNSTKLYKRATEKLKRINKAYECLNAHFLNCKASQSPQNHENVKSNSNNYKNSAASSSDNKLFNEISRMMLKCAFGSEFDNRFSINFDKNRDLSVLFVIHVSKNFVPDLINISESFLSGYELEVRQQKIDSLKSRGWKFDTLHDNGYYILGVFGYNESNTLYWARFVFSTLNEILDISPNHKFYIE